MALLASGGSCGASWSSAEAGTRTASLQQSSQSGLAAGRFTVIVPVWAHGRLLRAAELLGRCCYPLVKIKLLLQVDRVRVSASCRLHAHGSGLGVLRADGRGL